MGGMLVEVTIVLAGVEFAILFLDKEEGGCLKGVERMDLSSGQVFFKEILSHLFLIRRQQVDFANF